MYANLSELIAFLEYGTRLHIGVLFFGNNGREALRLPYPSTIHTCPVCDEMKSRPNGFARCYKCRNAAIAAALDRKHAFGGLCINGVYEYIHPILLEGEVVAIVFIGNILPPDAAKITHRLGAKCNLLDTMERNFTIEQCERAGVLIEGYIRMLLQLAPKTPSDFEPLVENLKGYIEDNLEYTLDLSLLARMFHYNEKYLGRLFKRRTGESFSAYVNARRVERACHLLDEGRESITAIATRVGFNNVSYFNRCFRARMGMSPVQYRARHVT